MKEVTIKVFEFDELSDEAKERARAWYREGDSYPWAEENSSALNAFCQHFGISKVSWTYGPDGGSASARSYPNNAENIQGFRLYSWLCYHHFDYLFPPLWTGKKRAYSKVRRAERACPTGYCISESMLDPIYAFLKNPGKQKTLEQLLYECLQQWDFDCSKDVAYQNSDEVIDENIRANSYTFTVSGDFYE